MSTLTHPALPLPRLTPDERARWKRKLTDPLTVGFALATVLIFILLGILGSTIYSNRREVTLLRIELQSHIKDRESKDLSWRAEFDNIYRDLYTPPKPNEARKQTYVEPWQQNRDKELRDRIRQLELRMNRLHP